MRNWDRLFLKNSEHLIILPLMKEKLLDSECPLAERSKIACILAELPLADVEVKLVQDNNVMNIFLEQISNRSHERAKQLAALGLKYLFNSSTVIISTSDSEIQPPPGFCIPFTLLCRKVPVAPTLCPLHSAVSKSDSSFCLLNGNAIKPLIDLMNAAKIA
ncbi:uncharacterized protein A4U43_UnF1560 [Asparagus officinalis]|uniref:Uncharacterized protein n=1 Tax=Asparagus officinalis TaxID=4686 RepID=A0A1R3L7I8_ASPOF|nr:uncharacterized protein A4U43_UnF1560 [Asparagus officinalis]